MKKILIGLSLVLLFVIVGCGSTQSPSKTVQSFYSDALHGQYSDMKKYIAPDLLSTMKNHGYGMNTYAKQLTDNGKVKNLKVINEKVKGEGATVKYNLIYKNGDKKPGEVSLIKDHGKWEISPTN